MVLGIQYKNTKTEREGGEREREREPSMQTLIVGYIKR